MAFVFGVFWTDELGLVGGGVRSLDSLASGSGLAFSMIDFLSRLCRCDSSTYVKHFKFQCVPCRCDLESLSLLSSRL